MLSSDRKRLHKTTYKRDCDANCSQEEGDMKSDTHQHRSARMLPMQLTDAAPALAAFLSGLGEELRCPTG